MKRSSSSFVLALLSAFLALPSGCQTPGPSSAASDSSTPPTAQQCQVACQTLAAASCPIGTEASCPTFLMGYSNDRDHANPATGKVFSCAEVTPTTVKTKADAQRMGFVCSP